MSSITEDEIITVYFRGHEAEPSCSSESSLAELSNDLTSHIFAYLPSQVIAQLARANNTLRAAVREYFTVDLIHISWKQLAKRIEDLSTTTFQHELPDNKEAELDAADVTPREVKPKLLLPGVKSITDFPQYLLRNPDPLETIAKSCPNLEFLDIPAQVALSLQGIYSLANLNKLNEIHLSRQGYSIDNSELERIAKLNNLTSLSLKDCRRITHEGLEFLENLPNLRSLNLAGCFQITDVDLAIIATSPKLEALDLSGCQNITDEGLNTLIQSKPNLRSLRLKNCQSITNTGLQHISRLSLLNNLDLSKCREVTDDGLLHLTNLKLLTDLDLSGCYLITDTGASHLPKLINLESMSLSSTGVTDEALAALSELPNIKSLDLSSCIRLTEASLHYIQNMKYLKELDLTGCRRINHRAIHTTAVTHGITVQMDWQH